MPFATHYGKYFQNSIREEALVSNSRAGIIYGQGGGGTLREVFQDVTAVHNILSAARYGIDKDDEKVRICMAKVRFTDDLAAIDQILSSHVENARQNLKFALNSEPLKVTTSRINRV